MDILINGLIFAGIYALLAVGFALVFGVAKLLNLAHTAFYMAASFLILTGTVILRLPLLPIILASILIVGILGMLCYKFFLDRVKAHGTTVLIISVAIAIAFQEAFLLLFGGQSWGIPAFIPGFVTIAGTRVLWQHIFAILASMVFLGAVGIFLTRTRLGIAIRAIANDRETANLMGIDVSQVSLITMGISAALAAIAGAIIGPVVTVQPRMWLQPLIIVLAAVVLGGFGSIKGSIIGAYILGLAESAVIFLIPTGAFLRGAVSLAIMVIILMIKPEGLFGVVFEEERL